MKPLSRLLIGILGTIASALALAIAWLTFALVPEWTWSGVRLAASARLAYGLPLYTAPHGANLTDWIYGPVAAIAYLPAMIGATPLAALRVAAALNATYFSLPLVILVWPIAARRRPLLMLVVLATGLAGLLASFSGWYAAACLSADTVAMGLGIGSCLVLGRRGPVWIAAALAAAAVWTKQTELPLLAAEAVYLWLSGRRQDMLGYVGTACGFLLALGVIFCVWFGGQTLLTSMVLVPKAQSVILGRLYRATDWAGWLLAFTGIAIAVRRVSPKATDFGAVARVLALSSVFLLPGGLMASAKVGGAANSVHSVSFAVLAVVAVLADLLLREESPLRERGAWFLAAGFAAALAADTTRLAVFGLGLHVDGSRHDAAYEFIKARPGRTYFPWYPLSQLMAEKKAYPIDYGLTDWRLSGRSPEKATLRAELPATVQLVVYHGTDQGREMLGALPDFKWERHTDDWSVYTQTP